MISESLAGKRIAITGSTGFLATAVVERILRQLPDTKMVLLVRPGRRGAQRRVEREILRHDCFDRLRRELGEEAFDARVAQNISVVEADITTDGLGLDEAGRDAVAACDIFVHSAATVSFDSPLDGAVEVNLMGPVRIVRTLLDLGSNPHVVAVSTAYVAGNRRGSALEELVDDSPFFVDVDWRSEVDAARARRPAFEADSRHPNMLSKFMADARSDLGAAGTPALAARSETLRGRWVDDQMVTAGRSRAKSLGFPDAYTFTKALAEKAMREEAGDLQVSIVRPSIIESAQSEPHPGWIRGFRMAEPIIINYGKGVLRDFPGSPEGVVDVIPVDMVAAAIVAVCAEGYREDTDVVQVASGSVNPLRYRELHDFVQEWFAINPLYDDKNQPIAPTAWTYPGRGKVEGQLARARKTIQTAESILHRLPIRGKQAEVVAGLEETRSEIEQAETYAELYGGYAQCEALYGVEKLLAMWARLPPEDQENWGFDPRVIDWDAYVGVHLPTVVGQARVKKSVSDGPVQSRSSRLRKQVLDPQRHVAAFDLENTLIASNVVTSWGWVATRRLPVDDRVRLVARTLLSAPQLLSLDRRDRSDFLRSFYRRYEGAPVDQMDEDVREMFSDLILAKSFPDGMRRVRAHRAAGHRTVLITGALDFMVEPLRPLFDDIVAAELDVRNDKYTGELLAVPPTGESRAQALRDYVEAEGLSLDQAVGYADSTSDLPMLEAVAFPVAVNPETKLASVARRRGWLVEHWSKAPGSPQKLLPIGPRTAQAK